MTRSLTRFRKPNALKRSLQVPILLLVFLVFPSIVFAQTYGSSSHNVTVTVATINKVNVSSGSVAITVTGAGAIAGQNLLGTASNTATTLFWASNSSSKKITVRSNLAAPNHTMKIFALNPTQGTAQPEITLSNTATDFVLNVGRTLGSCTLQYTAVVLASEGTASDTHTVTYTIATQ